MNNASKPVEITIARRLYEKLGFAVEGTLRKHLLVDGAFRDSYLMAVLYD